MDFSVKSTIFAHIRSEMEEVIALSLSVPGSKTAKTDPVNRRLWRNVYPQLRSELQLQSTREMWSPQKRLGSLLRLFYCSLVVNLEARNKVFPYDYMDFARRIGEVWEDFCKVCWDAPVNAKLRRLTPPTFATVREALLKNFEKLAKTAGRAEAAIMAEYSRLVDLLGNINLTEDEYCELGKQRYVIDFKSGFGSNEKGNTERLLTVAKIYRLLPEKHTCVLAVRSKEDEGNNYLKVLKTSKLWTVYCGADAYAFMKSLTGFDLSAWVRMNVAFHEDMERGAYQHLSAQGLTKYLAW